MGYRRGGAVVGVAVALVLAGCGEETRVAGSDPQVQTHSERVGFLVVADGEIQLSCGGERGWPPSAMASGVPGVLSDDEATGIFRRILDDPRMGEEAALSILAEGTDVQWRVLEQDATSMTLGLGEWTAAGPAPGAHVLSLDRIDDAWQATGWGDCRLAPRLQTGHAWVEVVAADGDAATSTLVVKVSERQCAGGRDPGGFLQKPAVLETTEDVTLYWTSVPAGEADCPGNPVVERTVELTAPLGERAVLDGSQFPPRGVRVGR